MFLHSVAVQDQDIAADGLYSFDLAVNPLSVILLCLRPLNKTGTLANFASYLNVCGALNRVTVFHRGEAIIAASGRDLAAMAYFRQGCILRQNNHDDVDNDRRCVILPVFMGRMAYDMRSCFPASRRGELVLELDVDISDTGYDDIRLSVEQVELLDARPGSYERITTVTQTHTATGDNDIDLPVGNMVRGCLLFGTTSFVGGTPAPSLGRLSTLLDNQQHGFSSSDFEVAHALSGLLGGQPPQMDSHTHRVDATSASTTEESGGPIEVGSGGWQNYCYLDFDPTRDDEFSVRTGNASRFAVRSDVETADLVRALAVEVIPLGG